MQITDAEKPVYSLSQFEKDVQAIKPRVFDLYILPGFMMVYAYKSKGMKRLARRMLFTSGIYMGYRNYAEYKKAYMMLYDRLKKGADNEQTA